MSYDFTNFEVFFEFEALNLYFKTSQYNLAEKETRLLTENSVKKAEI